MNFTIAEFRALYPEFSNVSDDYLTAIAEYAPCFIVKGKCKCDKFGEMLMTAHLLKTSTNNQDGSMNGVITSATIDKVSVALKAIDTKDSWVFWLNQTSYGQQLLALVKFRTAGGIYGGGRPERAAFRGVGGRFPNGGRSW